MSFDELDHFVDFITQAEVVIIMTTLGELLNAGPELRFLRVAIFAEENHRAYTFKRRVMILRRILENFLSRARTSR